MSKTSSEYTYTPTNDIEIYNNTKYILTVRYSGVESMKIVLSPKEKKTINLKNGDYRVTASVNAANVTNYAGKEKLEGVTICLNSILKQKPIGRGNYLYCTHVSNCQPSIKPVLSKIEFSHLSKSSTNSSSSLKQIPADH